jgi:hypothetical protein
VEDLDHAFIPWFIGMGIPRMAQGRIEELKFVLRDWEAGI